MLHWVMYNKFVEEHKLLCDAVSVAEDVAPSLINDKSYTNFLRQYLGDV